MIAAQNTTVQNRTEQNAHYTLYQQIIQLDRRGLYKSVSEVLAKDGKDSSALRYSSIELYLCQ